MIDQEKDAISSIDWIQRDLPKLSTDGHLSTDSTDNNRNVAHIGNLTNCYIDHVQLHRTYGSLIYKSMRTNKPSHSLDRISKKDIGFTICFPTPKEKHKIRVNNISYDDTTDGYSTIIEKIENRLYADNFNANLNPMNNKLENNKLKSKDWKKNGFQ